MSDLPAGYWQAIDNLAWEIRKLTEVTISPMYRENPLAIDKLGDDMDKVLNFCEAAMSEAEHEMWSTLDEILGVVIDTYETDHETVWNHVFARLYQYDVESGMFGEIF